MMELVCESSYQLKAVNYFRNKAPSQLFDSVLNTPLKFKTYVCLPCRRLVGNGLMLSKLARTCSAVLFLCP